MRVFGIDPGLNGAWALVVDGRAEQCGDIPTTGEGTKRRVAAGVLATIMRSSQPTLCVIELVGAMPGNAGNTMFRFGMSYGAVIAVANVIGVPLELVVPPVWKRHHRLLGTDKEASRQKAIDLAPHLSSSLARKLDTGRAEAILIGIYGEATWGAGRVAA